MNKSFPNSIHRLLGKSSTAARLSVKIRNQANCIIGYHLGESSRSELNGEFNLIRHLASRINTFIDVGANIGDVSDQILKHSRSRGFLFEPSLQCADRLKQRFSKENATVRALAVSDYVGTATFAEEDEFGEGSSLAEVRTGCNCLRREVPVTTLDAEFADQSDLNIDFLKIDTEGYDLKVIKGATKLLPRTRFIQFEYNSHWISVGSSLLEAQRLLSSLGFSIFLVRSSGLHPLRYEFWQDYFRYSNYLACRPTDFDSLRPLLGEPI